MADCSKKRRQRRIQRTLELYKLYDNKCQHCGCESYRVGFFDFHHINPDEKEANIGTMVKSYSWEKILAEVEKCAMLCPNCHRLEHIDLREYEEINGEAHNGRINTKVGRGSWDLAAWYSKWTNKKAK